MIIEFAKEVVNKRASSNSLHPPFQGAEHQKLHHFYCPCLKRRICLKSHFGRGGEIRRGVVTADGARAPSSRPQVSDASGGGVILPLPEK